MMLNVFNSHSEEDTRGSLSSLHKVSDYISISERNSEYRH